MAKFFFAVEMAWGVLVGVAVVGFLAVSFAPECIGKCEKFDLHVPAGAYSTQLESLDGLTVVSIR